SVVRAVFCDLDYKNVTPDEAQLRIQRFPLQPSITVESGGGLHLYWILSKTVDLRTHAVVFRTLLRRTARAIGADLQAAEPARVLRIPGTHNYKYEPPREVRLV